MNNYMTHDQLQHIEHCNTVLREHQELVLTATVAVQGLLVEHEANTRKFVGSLQRLQVDFNTVAEGMLRSARELKVIAGGTNDLIHYVNAVVKVAEMLDRHQDLINRMAVRETKEKK